MKSVTIIGGGASGTLLTVNLINQTEDQPILINLIEKRERIGRGVAYSTDTDIHRLNVPANQMGAFPYDVEHFYKWLLSNGHDYSPNDFVPRRIYGEYLQSIFDQAVKNKNENVVVNRFYDEAVDISIKGEKSEIALKSGRRLLTNIVVLAFGNFLPPHPRNLGQGVISNKKYFQNPWAADLINKLDPKDEVLVIGTGLTGVDTILSLYENRHLGTIHTISTHGWFPSVHQSAVTYPDFSDELIGKTSVRQMFKTVRNHIENAEKLGGNWRDVIDSLRHATQSIWLSLPYREKLRFMRHLRRIWDISRHRIPKECAQILGQLKDENRLDCIKGRISEARKTEGDRLTVSYTAGGEKKQLTVDAIINCTGSESNFAKLDIPLVKSLLSKGYVKPYRLFLGLEAEPDGKISDTIYTLGTALKGVLWESTAMPEITGQAYRLSLDLISLMSDDQVPYDSDLFLQVS